MWWKTPTSEQLNRLLHTKGDGRAVYLSFKPIMSNISLRRGLWLANTKRMASLPEPIWSITDTSKRPFPATDTLPLLVIVNDVTAGRSLNANKSYDEAGSISTKLVLRATNNRKTDTFANISFRLSRSIRIWKASCLWWDLSSKTKDCIVLLSSVGAPRHWKGPDETINVF